MTKLFISYRSLDSAKVDTLVCSPALPEIG